MDQSRFLHTWSLPRRHVLVRNYARLLGERRVGQMTFCKLFWLTLFTPLILPVHIMVERMEQRRFRRELNRGPRKQRDFRRCKSFADATTDRAELIADWFARNGKYILMGVGVVALGFLGWVAWVCFNHTVGFLEVLAIIGAGIGGAIIGVSIIAGCIALEENYDTFTRFGRFLQRVFGPAISGFFIGLWRSLCFIGRFFATGYYAIKTRTCPRVLVTSEVPVD